MERECSRSDLPRTSALIVSPGVRLRIVPRGRRRAGLSFACDASGDHFTRLKLSCRQLSDKFLDQHSTPASISCNTSHRPLSPPLISRTTSYSSSGPQTTHPPPWVRPPPASSNLTNVLQTTATTTAPPPTTPAATPTAAASSPAARKTVRTPNGATARTLCAQ